jgi:hypothetical protein
MRRMLRMTLSLTLNEHRIPWNQNISAGYLQSRRCQSSIGRVAHAPTRPKVRVGSLLMLHETLSSWLFARGLLLYLSFSLPFLSIIGSLSSPLEKYINYCRWQPCAVLRTSANVCKWTKTSMGNDLSRSVPPLEGCT